MSAFALVRTADRLVVPQLGVCVTCLGGARVGHQCYDCAFECPVPSLPTVAEINAAVAQAEARGAAQLAFDEAEEARWDALLAAQYAVDAERAAFDAAMAGEPYAYEAWDADAVYIARSASRAENWGVPLRVARAMTLTQGRVA
jgi:hypothetical protein